MEITWKAYKENPGNTDSWEWVIEDGRRLVARRLNEANAERIVKAVNSYDAMKKALKELLNGEVRTQARLKVIEALANAE
ncbi:hypothetical protein LCGC14_1233560 [marine sediment metagenome]|uniref:Uncharacterized protein n=1 Tax=marine sediment metagenome TaxID=412755 RepID=A0A0F9LV38_9ZZZZ